MISSALCQDSRKKMAEPFERAAAIVRDVYRKDRLEEADHKLTACMAFIKLFQSMPGFNKKEFYERCEVGA